VFGGYPRYLGAKVLPLYQKLPRFLRQGLSRAAPLIAERVSSRNVGGWARRFLASGAQTGLEAYSRWMEHLSVEEKAALYSDRLLAACRDSPARIGPRDNGIAEADLVAQAFQADLSRYLPENLLALADRASMSVGLELRVPLCDVRLAEFMLNLPSSFRVRGVTLKPLLKELLRDRLPSEILSQKKQGFMVPLGHWFRDEMRSWTEKSLEDFGRRGIVRVDPLRAFWKEHLSGRRNRTDILWAAFLLEHWFRRYHPDWRMDKAPASSS
ncbi:MAG: asparagine synthase C-terminal domain-containing protein, partial [Elusimicrobia bacterium]|nr:asparagine synthase C-terminal domain-containing protein [Elusimicrobiota bacterium]